MARNDETVTPDDSDDVPTQRRESDPKTSEYPEITSGPLTPRRPRAAAGRRRSVTGSTRATVPTATRR